MDTASLLPDHLRSSRRSTFRGAALFLGRATSRRRMREPSMAVREAAAEELEVRQTEWAYSKPVVLLDLLWNLAFVAVAAAVLAASRDEKPKMPLRVWVVGYAAQCVAHMVCAWVEYRKRRARRSRSGRNIGEFVPPSDLEEGSEGYDSEGNPYEERTSIAKHLESANTLFSFIWWITGFYWVTAGGPSLTTDAPQLYWLCIAFLAFDVFFVVFCVALAFIIGIAVCCCLPCIIAILYAVADQEGASDEVIHQLPKYKFRKNGDIEKQGGEISGSVGGIMSQCGSDPPQEHVLSAEDAECCICITGYDDGVELRELPCGHHFHCTCIDKWLHINATCPLCKYNILRNSNRGNEEA